MGLQLISDFPLVKENNDGGISFQSNKDVEIKLNMELSNKTIQKENPIVLRQRTHATTLKLTIVYLGRNAIVWIMSSLNKLVNCTNSCLSLVRT